MVSRIGKGWWRSLSAALTLALALDSSAEPPKFPVVREFKDALNLLNAARDGDSEARVRVIESFRSLSRESLDSSKDAADAKRTLFMFACEIDAAWDPSLDELERLEVACSTARSLGNKPYISYAEGKLIDVLRVVRGTKEAAERAIRVLEETEGDRSSQRAFLEVLRISLDTQMGLYSQSWERLAELRNHWDPEEPHSRAVTETHIENAYGQLDLDVGRPDNAVRHFQRAQEWLKQTKPQDWLLRASSGIYQLNADIATGNFSQAVTDARDALSDERISSSPRFRAEYESRRAQALALIDLAADRTSRSTIEALDEACGFAALAQPQRLVTLCYASDWHRRAGEFDEARAKLADLDSFLAKAPEMKTGGTEARRDAIAVEIDLADSAASASLPVAVKELEASYHSMLGEWDSALHEASSVAFLNYGESRASIGSLLSGILRLADDANSRRHCVEILMEAQDRGTLTRYLHCNPVTFEQLRDVVAANQGVGLIYLPAPERSHLFLIDADSIDHYDLPGTYRIDAARNQFTPAAVLRPAERDKSQDVRARAKALGTLLLPDAVLARLATAGRISIVGGNVLGFVPFEFLPGQDSKPLCLTHEIVYLPSASVGGMLANKVREDGATSYDFDLKLVDSPVVSRVAQERFDPAPLKPDPVTRKCLEEYFDSKRLRIVEGESATVEQLTNEAKILEIVAHGDSDLDAPFPPCVLLTASSGSPNGIVHCDEILGRRASPLVIQLSCSASKTASLRGEDGLSNFSGTWLANGAHAVIVPSREVEIEATRRLFDLVHENLRMKGETIARALLEARNALALRPGFEDPYYYALIHLYGCGDEQPFPGGRAASPAGPAGPPDGPKARRPPLSIFVLAVVVAIITALVAGGRRRNV